MKKPALIPKHLKKYVVKQDYSRYTPEDQAVWRYIMRQLKSFLKSNAHHCYEEGLRKTGLSTEEIPRISEMNKRLNRFGWGAVPVSGFIPPTAFMEFQSLSYLPIACEMRSVDHIHYTPAPDIVHEAAGHAPIIIDKNFSNYLKAYAEVASHAIINKDDMDLYEAIRLLSDAKENPKTTPAQVAKLENQLLSKSKTMSAISEAGLLGRMNWWTAEYGLIGSLNSPKIYGAGLLSSIGESQDYLSQKVRKIPFDMSCLDYAYDITEPQPQLFVTPSFQKLTTVLKTLGKSMAYSQGGESGLKKAAHSKTVNSVLLNSGLQISGILESYLTDKNEICFLKMSGPTQLSCKDKQLVGHSGKYHSHGYSTPIGLLKNCRKCLSQMTLAELKKIGISKNKFCVLKFQSGIVLSGQLTKILKSGGKNLLMSFKNCTMIYKNEVLFHPDWGAFDMACAHNIPAVFGGPADRAAYGETADFVAKKVQPRRLTAKQKNLMELYKNVRRLRKLNKPSQSKLEDYFKQYRLAHSKNWLLGLEIYELSLHLNTDQDLKDKIYKSLSGLRLNTQILNYLNNGIKIANLDV